MDAGDFGKRSFFSPACYVTFARPYLQCRQIRGFSNCTIREAVQKIKKALSCRTRLWVGMRLRALFPSPSIVFCGRFPLQWNFKQTDLQSCIQGKPLQSACSQRGSAFGHGKPVTGACI